MFGTGKAISSLSSKHLLVRLICGSGHSTDILYVKNALSNGNADHAMVLGNPGDQGFADNWTSLNYDGLGVFRPTGSTFF